MSINILNDNFYFYNNPIGFGSFSTVFKGTNYNSNKEVAIKKINKIIDKRHFDNEIKLMKSLSHINIIKLYDVIYKTKKEVYIVLEYCNEGDLSNYIETKINTFDNKYFYEILDALEYLYKKEILHRDIKPENILIHNNSIKITDFGFAKSFEKNELITTFCGSPLYMAPEIILNREYNYSSDIWSLGVVLYELLTKEHPYSCDSKDELWSKIKNNSLNINFDIIESINKKKIIRQLLTYDHKNRITWKNLFICITEARERSISFTEQKTYPIELSRSLFINKKQKDYLAYSVCLNNKIKVVNYDDCKVISSSAPNKLGSFYMKKYIKNTKDTKGNIPIMGTHIPHSNSSVFSSYLTKSVSTLRGFFSN